MLRKRILEGVGSGVVALAGGFEDAGDGAGEDEEVEGVVCGGRVTVEGAFAFGVGGFEPV